MKATIRDVARQAGVRPTTVSRVLNKSPLVTEETRQRVTRAIQATGYVPNLVAGSLASNRTHTILALVPTLTNPVFGQTLHALEEVLRRHGFHLLLGNSGNSPREEEALLATFLARRPDGIFLHSTCHTDEPLRDLVIGDPGIRTAQARTRPEDSALVIKQRERS